MRHQYKKNTENTAEFAILIVHSEENKEKKLMQKFHKMINITALWWIIMIIICQFYTNSYTSFG